MTAPLADQRILITGGAGQLTFPVAADLAGRNEVWGAARFSDPSGRERLTDAGAGAGQTDRTTQLDP
ncbi:MAG: NAD(P)-dependent oxidoreductase [Acidimicrobiales bacterium]|nr:NAD(P)-dependent oxidoreductase [Acidimicrobiales bacterium]